MMVSFNQPGMPATQRIKTLVREVREVREVGEQ
jgi:hypothetical protein